MIVIKPTIIFEDNMVVVLNSTEPSSKLQHHSIALSYHFCREYVAGKVVEIRHINSKANLADGFTKGLNLTDFHNNFMLVIVN